MRENERNHSGHGFRPGPGVAAAEHRKDARHLRPLQDLLEEAYPGLVFAQASLWGLREFLVAQGTAMALQPGLPVFNLPTLRPADTRPCDADDDEGCGDDDEGCGGTQGCFEFRWEGAAYVAVTVPVDGGFCDGTRTFLGAPSPSHLQRLVDALQGWIDSPRQEVLVFHRGYWNPSGRLSRSVREYGWDDVILPRDLKEDIQRTTEGFFSHRESYRALGLAYKRGLLFLGPPGCGKTLTLRIIAGQMALPFLYIRSFNHDSVEDNIDEVFSTAQRKAPCIVCWEDIDSLIPAGQMAFFLNALDGLESLDGLLTVASSNHPERIDRALLQRPSRFDRVFWFGLPDAEVRAEYLLSRLSRLEHLGMREEWPERARRLAMETAGYSFAYLQELFAQIGFSVLHEGSAFDSAAAAALHRLAEAMALARSVQDMNAVPDAAVGSAETA